MKSSVGLIQYNWCPLSRDEDKEGAERRPTMLMKTGESSHLHARSKSKKKPTPPTP